MEDIEKIIFETDDGEEEFFVLDETRINGTNYILVTDCDDVDAEEIEVLILKDVSSDEALLILVLQDWLRESVT